ncbi:MAG: branched-chain amino acid ABC transporter permease [Alcaligenaceae bacterium]|nr:branched-chain amino acid ABC transporter permease [Alcaligenaceae bacterium]
MSLDLFYHVLAAGIPLGFFYAAVSIGLSLAFGLIDIPHIAHPAFLLLGSYGTYLLNMQGVDPIVAGIILVPVFYLFGMGVYQFYHVSFERHGSDTAVRGLAFFFGLSFVLEAALIAIFGVNLHTVTAPYIGQSVEIAGIRIPTRMLVACAIGIILTLGVTLYLSRTFTGRALKAVAQDQRALLLVGAEPVKIKRIGFAIATAVTAIAGALLIITGPVEPGLDRAYIGKTFCVVVLGGMGSLWGTLVAALIVGLTESFVLSTAGASWAAAVSFGLLLLLLAFRPSGLFGK